MKTTASLNLSKPEITDDINLSIQKYADNFDNIDNTITKKIQTCNYTATVDNTSNIPFTFTNYDSMHDDMIVSYQGMLLDNPDNYTLNSNGTSIDLADWSISLNDTVKFRLYKNVK